MKKKIKRKIIRLYGGFDPYNNPKIIDDINRKFEEDEIIFDFKETDCLHYKTGIVLESFKSKLILKGKKLKIKNINPFFLKILNFSGHNWNWDLQKE